MIPVDDPVQTIFIFRLMPSIDYIGSLIFVTGGFLAFFLGVLIFIIKAGDVRANRILSLFCFATAIYLVRGYLMISGCYTSIPLITLLMDNARYALGPCVLFYTRAVLDSQFCIKREDVFHFLPLLINILLMRHVYVMDTVYLNNYMSDWFTVSVLDPRYLADSISRLIFFITCSIYFIVSFYLIRNSKRTLPGQSPEWEISLAWLRRFTVSIMPVLVIWFVIMIMIIFGVPKKYLYFSLYFFVSLVTFICGIFALMHSEIFYQARPVLSGKGGTKLSKTDQDADFYLKRITQLMEVEEAYLDPDLSLTSLSRKINIHRNRLSMIINEKIGHNFSDFINSYRIKKICHLMKDPKLQDETILTLAFRVGFNSKAPFYNAFKKFVGEVPSVYRKRALAVIQGENVKTSHT